MNLADCYRVLGLRSGASLDEIKMSYRRLARQFHPDTNPGDQQARDKFITLTEAYKLLISVVKPEEGNQATAAQDPDPSASPETEGGRVKVSRKAPPIQMNPDLSPLEQQIKRDSYEQLQYLLKHRRFPRAIALVEGLAQRLPKDAEVRQWQAITYQRCGRHFIDANQLEKARAYLKKALKTDPRNRSLWAEVEKDFRRIEQLY
ncbi:molecular chaperone DnaJ [Leptolyngbya sp. 'hensonii']|uniref:J domain-containing protein n=1 Tax=Leptolyngbya sp. 'hensonii' TaxID=1922337 RepID=UPI00094FFEAE|nr:J domain-containing protein [Leptolyngbya sp. 'hensonii']OLP19980.1 molecular chaperone DnaJ [Leptolyngbya sp. 'hensonii']